MRDGGIGASPAVLAGGLPRSKHLILDVKHCQTKAKAFKANGKGKQGQEEAKKILARCPREQSFKMFQLNLFPFLCQGEKLLPNSEFSVHPKYLPGLMGYWKQSILGSVSKRAKAISTSTHGRRKQDASLLPFFL